MPERETPAFKLGSAGVAAASIGAAAAGGEEPGIVWLLEDTHAGGSEGALAIAERLGVEFRRVPLRWRGARLRGLGVTWRGAALGSLCGLQSPLPLATGQPGLTMSSGRRAARVAAWLKQACGSVMVQYGEAGLAGRAADLRVVDAPVAASRLVLPVLGAPQRVCPTAVQAARAVWRERLEHLPHPRLALVLGCGPFGSALPPSEAFRLGQGLTEALRGAGGAILAMAGQAAGAEAVEALAAGLGGGLHLLHREGEPGPDPGLGFMALADAIVVAGHAGPALLRACALPVPVYVAPIGPTQPRERRLQRRLAEAGHVRKLEGEIGGWSRPALDEAGRAAREVRALMARTCAGGGAGGGAGGAAGWAA